MRRNPSDSSEQAAAKDTTADHSTIWCAIQTRICSALQAQRYVQRPQPGKADDADLAHRAISNRVFGRREHKIFRKVKPRPHGASRISDLMQ
ncbi:hypothetical protein E2C01_005103 [Portunus trituberculatus]|uniref:Uncharacterized protein n=1 Tax=Portunus trituberculatus TaxID=210409 RepID=A0A5B7CU35_PORTR|nr:hypothetical protein [Portunus trituberculatus]